MQEEYEGPLSPYDNQIQVVNIKEGTYFQSKVRESHMSHYPRPLFYRGARGCVKDPIVMHDEMFASGKQVINLFDLETLKWIQVQDEQMVMKECDPIPEEVQLRIIPFLDAEPKVYTRLFMSDYSKVEAKMLAEYGDDDTAFTSRVLGNFSPVVVPEFNKCIKITDA